MKQLGKRGRKTIRSVKRKRYSDNFAKRYGMTRPEWVTFKKEARGNGDARQIDIRSRRAYELAIG